MMFRKTLLSLALAMGVVGLSPVMAEEHAAKHEGAPHWSYAGEGGPVHWGELSADYATCKLGQNQSPINIDTQHVIKAELPALKFDYHASQATVVNNGHTIQVNLEEAGSLGVGEASYQLVQFHFHSPSEHTIDGKHADLVAHLVHKNAAGQLAVVGVLFNTGEANAALQKVWAVMPQQVGEKNQGTFTFNPAELLPADTQYYAYTGSLTTPPCSEGVAWHVLKQIGQVSAAQVKTYAGMYPQSVRPVQPANAREVKSSN